MRQSAVLSEFLQTFPQSFARLGFRGMRRLRDDALPPYSLVMRVTLGTLPQEFDLHIVVLGDGHPEDVRRVLEQIELPLTSEDGRPALRVLLAPYMGDEARALCAAAGVGLLDLAGNALLTSDAAYFEIAGRENIHSRKRDKSSPFRGRAERITRRLLLDGNRRWSMRELSAAAEASLGLTSMVTTALAEAGLVAKSRRGLTAHDPTALLDAWAEQYDLRRSPFVIYRTWLDVAEIESRLQRGGKDRYALTLWSGMRHLLGEPGRQKTVALYWAGETAEAENLLQLVRRTAPTYVFVFQPYDECLLWGSGAAPDGVCVVHPLQLYLDLGSGDEEEVAQARRVRETLLGY